MVTIKDDQTDIEIRSCSMDGFDRWRESCLAILENGLVIPCFEQSEWLRWTEESFSAGNQIVAEDEVAGFLIATEFLGINHNVTGIGLPLWFETLVFRETVNVNLVTKIEYGTVRYSTVAEAIAGHVAICEKVKTGEIGE